MGSRYLYTPSRMHPKIMLYAKENAVTIQSTADRSQGVQVSLSPSRMRFELHAMQRNNTAAGRGLKGLRRE